MCSSLTLQILLNLILALVWMLLHDVWNTLTFAIGYVAGLIIIYALRRFFPTPFYGRKVIAAVKLLALFSVELVKSCIIVIGQIIRPQINIKPGIFKMETKLKSEWQMMMLANMITLTPGSVIMEVAPEEGVFYVHAMDVAEFQDAIVDTKNRFEEAIIEVMG